MARIFIILFLLTGMASQAQDMLKALKREHNMYRFGIGVQASDPLGINLQLFHGFFCSNDDTYATKMVWELTGGVENSIFTSGQSYKTGVWKKGGFQSSLGAHYPVANILTPYFTTQFYAGAGLQGGTRKYKDAGEDLTDTIFGVNVSANASFMGRGITMGDGIWFITLYGGIKLHKQFGEDFSYVRPSLGLVFRKAR